LGELEFSQGLDIFRNLVVNHHSSVVLGSFLECSNISLTYRLGKAKIKPLLDRYCQKENLPALSQAKIGRIIERYSLFYQKQTKIYHSPASGYERKRRLKKTPLELS